MAVPEYYEKQEGKNQEKKLKELSVASIQIRNWGLKRVEQGTAGVFYYKP